MLALLVMSLAGAVLPDGAYAGNSACRRDPVVYLSNGMVVQITAEIQAPIEQVERLVYVLRAPQGTNVQRVVYTGGHNNPPETLLFYADMPENTYSTTTTVYTHIGASVTAMTRIRNDSASATGNSGEPLTVWLRP
jgi:hypothetical protein